MKTNKPAGISEKVIRLLGIYTMIARKKYPSVQKLKEEFRVSERSIYRYLEIINLIDGIEFDDEMKGYVFTNGDRIKKLSLKEQELVVLLAAGEAVSHLGKPLGENFQQLVAKMTTSAATPGQKGNVPIIIKIPDAIASEKLTEVFRIISESIDEKRSVEMTYRAQRSKETTTRLLDPYGLVFYEGAWIVIGYCHLRKQIRSFALDRILNLKERYLYFKVKEGFNLKDHLSRSWGVYDDKDVAVTVRFTAAVANYVLRKKWHPSEKRRVLPDGSVELTFDVAGVEEIKHWIYSWLPNVEVVKPVSFREQVKAELMQGAKRHE